MSSELLLSCQSISKSYGTQTLFSDLSLSFFSDERLGLIGPNGSGKSTLLKMLAGLEEPDSGKIALRGGTRLFYLPQEDRLDPAQSVEEVLEAARPKAAQNWEQERSARDFIQRIAFPDLKQEAGALSGGWRKRLAIAQAFLQKPDLLLMDEPTNHLDLGGILWLEGLLSKAPFAFVLVSHDRVFLENATNRIVELHRRYPCGFLKVSGPYSTFLQQREAFVARQTHQEEVLSNKVRQELAWLRRGPKARATKARARTDQAGALQDNLEAVKRRNAENKTADLSFNATNRKTRKLIETKHLGIQRSGRWLFKDLDLCLGPGQCLGVLGGNGTGKSTLIHLLNGVLPPDLGSIRFADGLQVVTFGQEREQLDRSKRLKAVLCPTGDQVFYRGRSMHIAAWAKRFLFSKEQLNQSVLRLSGGEQARVLIANLMLKPADVLLLDEPTNDLDIPTLEILEESLSDFPGAILLVTHDRFLLDRLSDQILALEDFGRTAFFSDYTQWQQTREAKAAPAAASKPGRQKKDRPAKALALRYEEKKELRRIEKKIEKAEAELEQARHALHDPAVASDPERLLALSEALEEAEEKVNRLYQRWEVLEALKP